MNPAVVTCHSCRRELTPNALFCPGCGSPRVKDGGDDLLGKILGDRFLIVERIGHGKSGTLYKGEHVTLRRRVAVKVLHDELSRDDLAVERFRREATSVAELDNEHIVEIHDFGRTPDNRLYMAMELLEGETLDQTLARERRLDLDRAIDVMIQVGDALAFAHSVGFVHRDLRPRNIFLSVRRGKANFVKLLDFGLSKLVETGGAAASTSLGMTFGDPRYMSPEQAKGDAIDRRADIYSLGCIGYEMLTGAPPFVGGKVFEVLSRHVSHPPVALREHRADAPQWLQAAIMRMLAKSPDDRFLTAARMVEALQLGQRTGEMVVEPVMPVADPASGSSSRRGPTGTPAVGVPAVAGAEAVAASSEPVVTPRREAAPVASAEPSTLVAPVVPPVPVVSTPVRVSESSSTSSSLSSSSSARVEEETTVDHGASSRRRASTGDPGASGNMSSAWFASGEEDAGLSTAKARRTIHPGDSLFEEEYATEPRRWVKPALIAGGVAFVALIVALIAGRGGDGGGSSPQAAIMIDAGVAAIDAAPAPPVDAAVAVVTPPSERRTTPSVPATDRPRPVVVHAPPSTPAPSGPAPDRQSELDRRLAALGIHPDPPDDDPGPAPAPAAGDEAAKMAEFYARAGEAALRNGDPVGAAGNYNKALASNPSNLDALIGLGEVALQQGQYSGAIGYLKKAARLAPKSSRINTLIGEAHLNSGNASAAEAAFKKALQFDPDNVRARNGYNEAAGRLPPPEDEPGAE